MTRAKALRQAAKQVLEMEKVERDLLKEFRSAMREVRRCALADPEGFIQDLESPELGVAPCLTRLRERLSDTSIAGHLLGVRRARKEMRRSPALQLSVVNRIADSIRGVDEEYIDFLRELYEAETIRLLQQMTTHLQVGLRNSLLDAIDAQVHPRAAVTSFFGKAGVDATPGGSNYFLMNMLRTQTQTVYGAARWQEYHSEDALDILWGFEYVTVGDDRVRPSHAAMDGVRLQRDHPFWKTWWPPNGWNCRCQAIPIFEPVTDQIPPRGFEPDKGFSVNFGILLNTSA